MCHFNSNNTSSKGVSQLLGWWVDANMKFKRFNFMPVLCSLLCLHCSLASILVIRSMSWDKQETIWWKLFLAARRLDDPFRRHSDEHALQYNSSLNSALWHKYICTLTQIHFAISDKDILRFQTSTICILRQILDDSLRRHSGQRTVQYITAHTPP